MNRPLRLGATTLGPKWVAGGRAEPLVAAVLCAFLGALLAFNLENPGENRDRKSVV